ncbi:hypothetical protein [Methanococcus maripaludis]|uniref:Uncharacterized protein n=2 Tax=Methanococcus maripaludis TaxID=39152 RepID=A0A7J9PJR3_METMI|nr:hypothetical protein [Methanococcus maripaludis]MBA2862920.1 hypothetical protein [Methanococcus maripaludis]
MFKNTLNGENQIIQIEKVETLVINYNNKQENSYQKQESYWDKKRRSLKKSSLFKTYVCEELFKKPYFKIFERECKFKNEPDYKVILKENGDYFYLKCKFRGYLYNNFYDWARPDQIDSFKEFSEKVENPVYFAFGLGGCPNDPDNLFLYPLEKIKCKLELKELEPWRIQCLDDISRIIL